MKKLKYLKLDEALEIALDRAKGVDKKEIVSVEGALNRVFSKDIECKKNLPSFNNSAMDGFVLKANSEVDFEYKISGTIFAGDKREFEIRDKECYKIMTGAKIPKGGDCVVPFENSISFSEESVKIASSRAGDNVRLCGEELKINSTIFQKGEVVTPFATALLASQGITHIEVFKKPTIAILSSGNELKEPWESADCDEIYNSNSSSIISLLKSLGFECDYVGVIPDSFESCVEYIDRLKDYDVIITTGGISMGEADFIGEAFVKNGLEIFFHGVNAKPGKSTMMGSMGKTFVMAMPGNPLTALLNSYFFASLVLMKIQNSKNIYHKYIYAKNKRAFKLGKNRANMVLGSIVDGEFVVTMDNRYGSGMVMPLLKSDAFVVSLDKSEVQEGETIKVIPFWFGFSSKMGDIYNRHIA